MLYACNAGIQVNFDLNDHICHLTNLINRDFGTLSDLCEGELSVVSRTSESHLKGKETFPVVSISFGLVPR